MVDWNSVEQIQKDAAAFNNFVHACIGIYMWEWAVSLDFDWEVITLKKRFRWPMIFYFLNRYTMFFAAVGFLIVLNDTSSTLHCQSLYTFIQVMGNFSSGLPSLLLAIRAIAVWGNNKAITGVLVVLIVGQWVVLLLGVTITASYVPGAGCTIIKSQPTLNLALFVYNMGIDTVTMILTAIKLASGNTTLTRVLFRDGLSYFITAVAANATAVAFLVLNLNPVMSVIFCVPAAIISTIVATRAFRRLSNFNNTVNVYTASGPTQPYLSTVPRSGPVSTARPTDNIHVKMETFQVTDEESGKSIHDHEAEVEYKHNDSVI